MEKAYGPESSPRAELEATAKQDANWKNILQKKGKRENKNKALENKVEKLKAKKLKQKEQRQQRRADEAAAQGGN